MDLPPPPPHRRHHQHHHLRYENVLRPPDFFSLPNPHHFPPPPHTLSLNTLLPPPPPPPPRQVRNMSPPPLSSRFAFSPPRHRVTERSHRYEFDPPPKPYSHPTRLPPPPPPPPRGNKPLRIILDRPQKKSVFETENFPRGRIDTMRELLSENRDQIMHWAAEDVHISAPDIDVRGRDDGRRRNSGISDWGYDLDNSRGYDERRWYSGMSDRSLDMYRDCYYDGRRWDSGMNDGNRDMYRENNFDERRWESVIDNQGRQLYIHVDDDEGRRDSRRSAGVLSRPGNSHSEFSENDLSFGGVLSRLGNRQPEFSDNDVSLGGILSRLGNRRPEFDENDPSLGGVLSRLGNRQPEFAEDDLSLGRFSGRLGVSKGEFIRKQRLQKKNTLLKTQLGKVRSKHSGGSKAQHFTKDSNGGSFKVKEKGYGKMQTRMENEREREQSPMELAISFKSNGLVAKAIQVPSNPSTELSEKSNLVKERLGFHVSALPGVKSVVVSDIQSDSRGTSIEHMDKAFDSGSGSVAANCARGDLVEMALENARLKVTTLKGSTMEGSDETCSRRSKRKKKKFEDRCRAAFVVPCLADENFSSNKSASYGDRLGFNQHVIIASNNEVPRLADENFSSNKSASYGDRLGLNQHVNTASNYIHDKTSVYDAEEGEIVPTDQIIELDSDWDYRVRDSSEHPDVSVPSEDIVSIKDHDPAGSQETRISELHEDNCFLENHELVPSPKSACEVMKMTEDAVVSDVGFKDANPGGFPPNQCNTIRIILAAKESKSLEGPAVKVSSPDNMGTVLSHNINSVEGGETCFYNDNLFPKGTTDHETCLSVDNSSKVIRKRKHAGDQMGLLSGTKTTVSVRTVTLKSIVARCLPEDIVPAMDGDFVGEKDSCKEDTSLQQGSSGVKDSLLEVYFSANGSFPGNQKKQTLYSPRSSLSSLSEDDTTAGGVSNPLILEQHSFRPSGWEAEKSGNTSPASITISQCETTGVEGEVGINDLSVVSLDENMLDGDRSLGNDDLALNDSGLLCSERNGPSASDSGDESLASRFDMRSCMTSPEELHVNSDSSFLENTKASACLLDNEMICQSDNISNKKHVFADPNTSSHGKCLGTAVSKSLSNIGIPQSLLKDTGQVVKKLFPIHSKLTWSKNQVTSAVAKVLPVQHPQNLSNSKKLYSSHATKSRTWCRTVNSTAAVAEPKIEPSPISQSNGTSAARSIPSSYVRKGNSLVRKDTPSDDSSHGVPGSSCSVYRLSHCTNTKKNDLATDYMTGDVDAPTVKRRGQINTSEMTKAVTLNYSGNSLKCTPCHLEEPLSLSNPHINDCPPRSLDVMKERIKSSVVSECQTDPVINSDSQSTARDRNSEKKIIYVKRRSNQLVATCHSGDMSMSGVDNTRSQLSDGYYKSRGNQLLRASNHVAKGNADAAASGLVPQPVVPKTSTRRQSGFAKSCRYSKFSFVWKLQDSQSSEKFKNSLGPRKVWPHLFSSKRAAYWRSLMLGIKPSLSNISQKLLVSRKRGAIYTRSSHGYSLKMSKVLSVGGSSLKWSKSIEKSSRKANEEATRAVAAAEKRKKEENGSVSIASKSRNHVSSKWVLSVKLRPGERIFRIGSERYKMDPTKRTLQRITAEKEPSSSVAQSKKNVKRSYVPRRLLIGNEEYVRIGNGNQLVRDPKKRIRVLASEKVRWSLRTARMRLARKRKYCQFFTRFGKCNKDDGKCPYIHDPSKIVVCTKFLTGSCTNINCKLTHKVMPERMQDCSYFLKGSCSNENCPYRHVHVNPDSSVCESFLRGYCADGNECQKKHTYVCPVFEATGVCPQASTCKLHHPKKKTEKKPTNEPKIVRGRYFDGGLVGVDEECSTAPAEKLSSKGKDNMVVLEEKFPDYISLEVSDDEADQALILEPRSVEIIQKGDDDVR